MIKKIKIILWSYVMSLLLHDTYDSITREFVHFYEPTLKLTGKSVHFERTDSHLDSWICSFGTDHLPVGLARAGSMAGSSGIWLNSSLELAKKIRWEMASFVTEVLASSGKLEKHDLASKISKLSRKVEETKVNKLGSQQTLLAS